MISHMFHHSSCSFYIQISSFRPVLLRIRQWSKSLLLESDTQDWAENSPRRRVQAERKQAPETGAFATKPDTPNSEQESPEFVNADF